MPKRTIRRGLVAVGLTALAIAVNLPLLWTILASLDLTPDNTVRPPVWHMPSTDSYLQVLSDPNLIRELFTSVGIALATTAFTVTVAFLAAYSLARARFRSREVLVQGFLILSTLPVISYVIPLRDAMLFARLYDTVAGLVLPETALLLPLAVYVLFGYLGQSSVEVEESAFLDGTSLTQILIRIVVPIAAPGIAATAILVFVLCWNQLLMPMVLTARHIQTLPVMLSTFFTYERELEWETAAVALVVTLLPMIAFVAVAFRLLERFALTSVGKET